MSIVKVLVDNEERDFVTSLDEEEIEINNDLVDDNPTIVLDDLIDEVKKVNEGSEING